MKRNFFITIAIIIAILLYTNPNKIQFESKLLQQSTPVNWNNDSLKYTSEIYRDFSIRHDYLIFSIFDFRVVDTTNGEVHKKYIGFFNYIITLQFEKIPK